MLGVMSRQQLILECVEEYTEKDKGIDEYIPLEDLPHQGVFDYPFE
jgi:hypothetical protein